MGRFCHKSKSSGSYYCVWEFYANVTKWEWDSIFVRGIHQFFTWNDLEMLKYYALISESFDATQIIEILATLEPNGIYLKAALLFLSYLKT